MPDRSWALAQLGIVHGGLGIRDPERHAGAAYLGSLAHTRALCGRMDPHFDPDDGLGALRLNATTELVRAQALDAAAVQGGCAMLESEGAVQHARRGGPAQALL